MKWAGHVLKETKEKRGSVTLLTHQYRPTTQLRYYDILLIVRYHDLLYGGECFTGN